ncbi:MAG: hypothetical protein IJI27_05410 [Oscillospiraceae bacterium]|nr:hypothetical protein [Oscillospiraceae bacterium]
MNEKQKLREQIRADAEKALSLDTEIQQQQMEMLQELLRRAETDTNTHICLCMEASEYADELHTIGGTVCRVDLGSPDTALRAALLEQISKLLL